MDIETERWNIDFDTSKSIRYHAYRRAFWDNIDRISKIVTIVSGTAVLVSVVGEHSIYATCLAVVVALASAADVVIGFSRNAREHDDLYRSFSLLAQNIAEAKNPTEDDILRWRRRRLEIEMDEPFIVDLLERRCSAEEAKARGSEVNKAWQLSRWQIVLSQFIPLPATTRNESPKET